MSEASGHLRDFTGGAMGGKYGGRKVMISGREMTIGTSSSIPMFAMLCQLRKT
jgi:hypothetical protein